MTEDGRMEIQKEKNGKVPNGSPKTGIEGEREKIHSLLEEFIGPGFFRQWPAARFHQTEQKN